MGQGGMNIMERTDALGRTVPAAVQVACLAALSLTLSSAPASAFERATQTDYDLLAFCYGQQVGAANGFADDYEYLRAAYPQPDTQTAQDIGMAQAHAVELSTLADATAALFEDMDHPGYEMDPVSTNAAYARGYGFWEAYMAVPFGRRAEIELTEETLGMSPDCWRTIFALETINAANVAAGELVWPD